MMILFLLFFYAFILKLLSVCETDRCCYFYLHFSFQTKLLNLQKESDLQDSSSAAGCFNNIIPLYRSMILSGKISILKNPNHLSHISINH